MLSERRAEILRVIVERYVAAAQPVSSAMVIQLAPLGVSSATVRNDMGWLEAEGYIMQPHTSAGRVPTDLGYRHYVDHYAVPDRLARPDRRRIAQFFDRARLELDGMLAATSRLLAELNELAALVVPPEIVELRLMSVHAAAIDPQRLLVVLVTETGRVVKVPVETAAPVATDRMAAANALLHDMLVGTPGWLARHDAPQIDDADTAAIVHAVLDGIAYAADAAEEVHLGGTASLAARFDEVHVVHDILETLEHQHDLLALLQATLRDGDGLVVRIGSELDNDELRPAAIVVAPYRSGAAVGLVGLVGPTRMDYSRAMSTVNEISARLEDSLSA